MSTTRSTDPAGAADPRQHPSTLVRLGVDAGCRDNRAADSLLTRLVGCVADSTCGRLAAPVLASTHLVAGPRPRVAVVATWACSPPADALAGDLLARLSSELPQAALVVADQAGRLTHAGDDPGGVWGALDEHVGRTSGRLARFAGQGRLHGELTVAEVVGSSLIDHVDGLAGTDVASDSVLHLDGHVRPTWGPHGCTLLVQHGARGLEPFEARHQVECCTDH